MVTKVFAEKHFSESEIKRAYVYGNYLCYEEDCEYAIPMFELKNKWDKIYGDTVEEYKENILSLLSLYNPDYLIEKGITPLESQYSEYQECKLKDKLQATGSADLIVSAWGDWRINIPGVIEVETAEGKHYYVNHASYRDIKGLKLLSKCKVIKEVKASE